MWVVFAINEKKIALAKKQSNYIQLLECNLLAWSYFSWFDSVHSNFLSNISRQNSILKITEKDTHIQVHNIPVRMDVQSNWNTHTQTHTITCNENVSVINVIMNSTKLLFFTLFPSFFLLDK